ncbi:MAG: hypothetical protein ACK4GT_17075 [Pararhodobacter sp.]
MSETIPPKSPKAKPRRGLRVALVASLMVNVLVIGVLVGGAVRMHRFEPPVQRQTDIRALLRAMPEDARRSLRETAREQGDRGPRDSREERRAHATAANARMLDVLRADAFDQAAFVQILQGDREAMERRLDAVHAAFAVQLGALDRDERQAMADRLEESWGERRSR